MTLGKRTTSHLRELAVVPVIVAVSVGMAACSGSSKASKAAAPPKSPRSAAAKVTPPTAVAPQAPTPKFTRVVVTASEYKLSFSKPSGYAQGNYTFSLKNAGHAAHSLEINGPGLKNQTSATVSSGQTTDLVVPMVKGIYQVWSAAGTDRAQGMRATIVVS